MNALVQFMNSWVGRIARIVLGLVLVYVGLVTLGGTLPGYVIAIVGLVPILMGIIGRCLIEFVLPKQKHA
jgi:hypothetical protein